MKIMTILSLRVFSTLIHCASAVMEFVSMQVMSLTSWRHMVLWIGDMEKCNPHHVKSSLKFKASYYHSIYLNKERSYPYN